MVIYIDLDYGPLSEFSNVWFSFSKSNLYLSCSDNDVKPTSYLCPISDIHLTDIPQQREEYEVIYAMRRNAECHITSILRAGVEYLFYFMTNSRYIFVTK